MTAGLDYIANHWLPAGADRHGWQMVRPVAIIIIVRIRRESISGDGAREVGHVCELGGSDGEVSCCPPGCLGAIL